MRENMRDIDDDLFFNYSGGKKWGDPPLFFLASAIGEKFKKKARVTK
jgi:hypothetical protein